MPLLYIGAAAAISWFWGKELLSLSLFTIVGGLATFLSWVVGMVQGVLTSILFQVIPYSDFIKEDFVIRGWVLVRDLCNMFFILILLIIAFAAILRIESYQWKKTLPKLIIMAILINFSKTICGLAIDFSQVIMLTFANAFSAAGAASLYDAFGMKNLYTFSNAWSSLKSAETAGKAVEENLSFATSGSIVLGLIMLIIATIAIGTYAIILIFRIVMLWILIILSPLAFLAMAIPAGAKYASQWMGEFTKYVIVGPAMVFFLWLALTMNSTSIPLDMKYSVDQKTGGIENLGTGSAGSTPNNMKNFIVTTLFLMAGLMMAQQMGAVGASVGSNAVGKMKSAGTWAAKQAGHGARVVGSYGLDRASMATNGRVDFNLARVWSRFTGQLEKNKADRGADIASSIADKASEGNRSAMIFHGGLTTKNLNSWNGIKAWAMGGERKKEREQKVENLRTERKGILTSAEYDKKFTENENIYKQSEQGLILKQNEIDAEPDAIKKSKLEKQKQKMEEAHQEFVKNKLEPFKNKTGITIDDKRAKELDGYEDSSKLGKDGKPIKVKGEIEKAGETAEKYAFTSEGIIEEAKAEASLRQAKKIAYTDSPEKLGQILQEAFKKGNQGLIAEVSKKLTKQGNYNNIAAMLKVGTGTQGMQDLAKLYQKAGMSEQSSRGLIAEMGETCKNLGQFSAFAAMKMDQNGNWQENNKDSAQAMQLKEKAKMQPQNFARNVSHLGLGHYEDPSGQGIQDETTYKIDASTLVYYQANGDALAKQYKETGQQFGMERVASQLAKLEANGISRDSELYRAIESRLVAGVSELERIQSLKNT